MKGVVGQYWPNNIYTKCSSHPHPPPFKYDWSVSLWLKVENIIWLNSLVVLDKHSTSLKGNLASKMEQRAFSTK